MNTTRLNHSPSEWRLDLVLAGFGHVAQRFIELLLEQRGRLSSQYGLQWRVVGVATLRHGLAYAPQGLAPSSLFAHHREGRPFSELHDASTGTQPTNTLALIARAGHAEVPHVATVLIETTLLDIERGQPATEHVRAALLAGQHVVTANKGPVAFAYRELAQLASERGLAFLFEGAVMDGIPIFNLVRRTLPAVEVIGFRGVVNSTTNYIITAMEEGREYEEALGEMQAMGVAEADPSHDVDGWDAAAKTAALANVLMHQAVTPHQVHRVGTGHLTGSMVRQAVAAGKRIKLVASAEWIDGAVRATVGPTELPDTDILAGLRGMANALVLRTDVLGELAVTEIDCGLAQTAYALVSDLVEVWQSVQE